MSAPLDVGAGGRVGAHPGDDDPPQGVVGLAVPAEIKPVPPHLPLRGRDRRDPAQVRPGGLTAQPFRVVPGRDQQQRRGVQADAVQGDQAGRGGDERDDELVQPLELAVGNSTRRPSSRSATRAAYSAASPGRGRSAAMASASASAECRANRARRSSGTVMISERAWLMVCFGAVR